MSEHTYDGQTVGELQDHFQEMDRTNWVSEEWVAHFHAVRTRLPLVFERLDELEHENASLRADRERLAKLAAAARRYIDCNGELNEDAFYDELLLAMNAAREAGDE